MSLNDFRDLLAKLMTDVLTPLVKIMKTILEAACAALAGLMDLAVAALDTEIYVPFVSDLLKWLFPDLKVTFGLVATFTIAVPFQVMFRAFAGQKFTEAVPESLPPLYSPSGLLMDGENEWKKHAWAASALGTGIVQAIADGFRFSRLNKLYRFGRDQPQCPTQPDVVEYLANFGLAALASVTAWSARNPTLWVQGCAQAVHGCRLVYFGYGVFEPTVGVMAWYDKMLPLGSTGVAIASLAVGMPDATTDKAKAELWCWNLPQIYRPITSVNLPPWLVGGVCVLDIGLCAAAAGLHWDQPSYQSVALT